MEVPLSTCIDPLLLESNPITVYGMPMWVAWLLIAIMLIISGLFSASENAFSNCNKYHFKVEANKGNITSKIIVRLTEKFEDTLVTVLVGNNIVQTLMSSISAVIFYNICKANGISGSLEAIFSAGVMGALVYIVSDTCPKILSKAIPNRMAVILAWPDFIVGILLFPIIFIFRYVLKAVHKIFKIKDENVLSKEDFIEKADEAKLEDEPSEENENNEELFEEDEMKLLSKAFTFDSIKIEQVMTKKENIIALKEEDLVVDKVNDFIMNSTLSRFPVINNEGEYVAILSLNLYFEEYSKDPHLDIRSILIQPVYVDIDETLGDAFEILNKEHSHLALVKNKDNQVVGLVTMDDILAELVGKLDTASTPIRRKKKGEKAC